MRNAKKNYRCLTLLALVSLLTACVNLDLPETNAQQQTFHYRKPTQRRLARTKITYWTIRGAFSIKQDKHADLADFRWTQHNKHHYQIHLSSALNLYTLSILGSPQYVKLIQPSHPTLQAKSAEQLLQRAVGWSLPVSRLYYWIRALPAPRETASVSIKRQYDQYGHLLSLQQGRWHIRYSDYIHLKTVDLPRIVTLTYQNLRIKIAIKHWSLGRA